jgi:hypothetical protein
LLLFLSLYPHQQLSMSLLFLLQTFLSPQLGLSELFLQHVDSSLERCTVLLGSGVAVIRAALVVGQYTHLLLEHLNLQQPKSTH